MTDPSSTAAFASESLREGVQVERFFALVPARWLRRVPGRETFSWPPFGAPRLVVKRTRRGSRRDRVHEWVTALREGRRPRQLSPGRREHENLVELARLGLAVPPAVAWAEGPAGSLVVMGHVEHHEDLGQRLAAHGDEQHAWSGRLVALVLALHSRGWYHRDLYLAHLALEPRRAEPLPRLVLLDVGRARHERAPARRWFVKDLAALLHSVPARIGSAARLRFLAAYLDGMGVTARAERRRWARDVLLAQARIARHVPRSERPGTSGGGR